MYDSVPSDKNKMDEIKETVRQGIANSNDKEHIFTVEEVRKAACKLKSKKGDGDKGLFSNHVKYANEYLYEHISLLLTAMLTHGVTPEDLLRATITSLPKDKAGNLCDSANYRGIALTTCLSKIYDIIIIQRYPQYLATSHLQFAFKEGHSTTMCNLVAKEVISYYNNNGSDVYCCMLDASKAFDRLRYDKLFDILLQRGMPFIVVRSLIDLYERQMVRTKWSDCYSDSFSVQNGIRQGGIVSPILYTVYADELIKRLQEDGIRCYVGHEFTGSPTYADDMMLLCPSVRGLQRMTDTCAAYGVEYDVLYNEIKSQCICFTRSGKIVQFYIILNGTTLKCVDSVKHIGIVMTHNCKDDKDIHAKRGKFIGEANFVISKYGVLTSEVQCKLFQTYCSNIYGSDTWLLSNKHIEGISTAWNIGIRKIWKLPYCAHRRLLPGLANMKQICEQMYRKFMKLYYSMSKSNNPIVNLVAKWTNVNARSITSRNIAFIARKWTTDYNTLVKMPLLKFAKDNNEDDQRTVHFIKEIKSVIDNFNSVPGFNHEELKEIYDDISTA